jgi:hypothetical protein
MAGTVSTGPNWTPSIMFASSGPNWTPIIASQQANGFQYLVFQSPAFQAPVNYPANWTPINTNQTG